MLAAPPVILESGKFLNIPVWVIGAFLGAAFVLIIIAMLMSYIFSGDEHPRHPSRRVSEESPKEIIDEFKEKYGMIRKHREGSTWGTVLFALIFLAFLALVGYLLGRYLQEGEPQGEEFVPYVQRAIIQPMLDDISSRLNLKK